MKVLVTGSSGTVGSIAVRELEERGHDVVRFDLKDGQDMLHGSAREEAMIGCDAVVHLAAIPYPDPRKSWFDFYRMNCESVARMANTADALGVKRFIFTSSTAYYGMESGIPFRSPVDESSPHGSQYLTADDLRGVAAPKVYYMQSKVIAENILAAYGLARQMEVAILRLSPMREDGNYCGLWMGDLGRAGRAIADLVEDPDELWYEVFNLAAPDCGALDTGKWKGRKK